MADPNLITKQCKTCMQVLPVSEFNKHQNTKDRLRPECKGCQKTYRRGYYSKHQDQLVNYSRNFYRENKEQVLEYCKEYRETHKEQISQALKNWRITNAIRLKKKRAKEYQVNKEKVSRKQRTYRQANKEKIAERDQQYAARNPEPRRIAKRNYKARRRQATGSFTTQQWLAKCEFWGWRCYLCGTPLTISTAEPEHRKPLSRGGSNWIANIAPACHSCNASKNNKTEAEYRKAQAVIFHSLQRRSPAALVSTAKPWNATGVEPGSPTL